MAAPLSSVTIPVSDAAPVWAGAVAGTKRLKVTRREHTGSTSRRVFMISSRPGVRLGERVTGTCASA
jgi:hypothetical protein